MAEKQKNQIIVIEPITKLVNDLLEAIMEKDQAEVSPFQNADEAIQIARQNVPCMLVLCIQSNSDIPPILNTLKKLKPDIKQGFVKTLLVSKVKNPQLQKLIGEFGVTDYIEEPVPARTLMFKANLQLKAVDTTRRQIELKKQGEEKIVFKTSKKGEEEAQNAGTDVNSKKKPALQLANDTFLIKNSAVKKQAKKYTVELDGPDPSTGEWVPEGEDPANPAWRWKPHDKEDEPGSEEGDGWVAAGEKPQFKPAAKKWQLSSEKPSLFFKKKNVKVAEKIGVDEDGEVVVAEDSAAAEENLRKNIAKVQRQKKKKAADAAGIPFVEDEPETAPAPAPAVTEEEEDEADLDPIVKAKRKAKRERKKAAIAAGLPVDSEDEEEEDQAGSEAPESAARQKLEKLRKARRERKKAAIAAGEPVDPADEEDAEIPNEAKPETEEEDDQTPDGIVKKKREKKSKGNGEGQLLDFLKKKKESSEKIDNEETSTEAEAEDGDAGLDAENSALRAKLKKRDRAKKARAEGSEELEEILADEANSNTDADLSAEPAEDDSISSSAEEETSGDEDLPDILKHAKERKRKRNAKKKALLEEIQAESEPSAEELELAERNEKAKAEGITVEEEPEEEKRNDRLEKLRKKRAKLEELEREELAEEEQGVAIHSTQADKLKGFNVLDAEEGAEGEGGTAEILLKKLKKERAARQEAKERAEKEAKEAAEFADSLESGGTVKKKKKKKVGEGTQAEGLENIFAESAAEIASDDLYEEGKSEEAAEEAPVESRSDRLERLRKKRDEVNAGLEENSSDSSEPATSAEKSSAEEAEDFAAAKGEKKQPRNAENEVSLSAEEKPEGDSGVEEDRADSSGRKKNTEEIASATEKLQEKSKTSDSMKRFLERRKQRKEVGALDLTSAKPTGETESAASGQKRSFLGIFVSISDSFGVASERKLLNIVRAFETSLENCAVALTSPRAGEAPVTVLFGCSLAKGSELPVPECRMENFTNNEEKLVAHLALRMLAPRVDFAEDESEAISRAVLALKPLVLQWLFGQDEKEKKAS